MDEIAGAWGSAPIEGPSGNGDTAIDVATIDGDETTPRLPPQKAKRRTRKAGPAWRIQATDRLRGTIKHYEKAMEGLVAKKANEAETRLLITEFLCEGLGFDRFADLDLEFQVRGNFVDYGLRVGGELVAFVECKSVGTRLSERHLRQVKGYVIDHPDVEWAIVTNGVCWQLYHVGVKKPISVDLILEADLLGDTTPGHRAGRLFYLTKESFKHKAIESLWKKQSATAPKAIASALYSPKVIRAIRSELHTITGHLADIDDITEGLNAVVRPECLEC